MSRPSLAMHRVKRISDRRTAIVIAEMKSKCRLRWEDDGTTEEIAYGVLHATFMHAEDKQS